MTASDELDTVAADQVRDLVDIAERGLCAAYLADTGVFSQTVRGVRDGDRVVLRPEGASLRYAAIAALGLARLETTSQEAVLGGRAAAEVVKAAVEQAAESTDPGAVAVVAWAAAEVCGEYADVLFARLSGYLASGQPLATVDVAWMLTAATAARAYGDTSGLASTACRLLVAAQGAHGIFPHRIPAASQHRTRAHVGSFADQVYPIQALARWYGATGAADALARAELTAARICELQGSAGQWWWHYDVRNGRVVEGYPVYSVHQHAMAPMVLFDLYDVGGTDHRHSILAGLGWLQSHPEVVEELVSERHGVVWRKVGRREPRKLTRGLAALTTSVSVGARLPGLGQIFPPVKVDYECRPYELGWLLYTWLATDDCHLEFGASHA